MDKICSVDGCYGWGIYYSDKAEWFCEHHKPKKLFSWGKLHSDEYNENIKKAVLCKGCKYLHVGENVSHNHCTCPFDRDEWDSFEKRANGRTTGKCPRKKIAAKNAPKPENSSKSFADCDPAEHELFMLKWNEAPSQCKGCPNEKVRPCQSKNIVVKPKNAIVERIKQISL